MSDTSTICRFRNQLHEKVLAKPLLDTINARRPRKQQEVIPVDRQEGDEEPEAGGHDVKTSYSGDVEAAWTRKGKLAWYGYKVHMAVDGSTDL